MRLRKQNILLKMETLRKKTFYNGLQRENAVFNENSFMNILRSGVEPNGDESVWLDDKEQKPAGRKERVLNFWQLTDNMSEGFKNETSEFFAHSQKILTSIL